MILRASFFSPHQKLPFSLSRCLSSCTSQSTSAAAIATTSSRSLMLYGGSENNPDQVEIINEKTAPEQMFKACVTKGKYLLSDNSLEHIHRAYFSLVPLVDANNPVETYDDYLVLQKERVRTSNLLLVKRTFWEYSDYRDPVMNRSFGLQNYMFDSYAWNNRLCFEFQDYVEKYFPVSEHSHLTYFEYCGLLRYFYWSYAGLRLRPALAGSDRIRPEYGVPVPEKAAMAPISLYKRWLENFQRTLSLNRALMVRSGCGVTAMVTRHCGVRMVSGVDSDPRAILSAKRDAKRNRFQDLSFKVAPFFPEGDNNNNSNGSNNHDGGAAVAAAQKKFDMLVFAPDLSFLQLSEEASHGSDKFAPSMTGVRGQLEQFFEEANDHLTDRGVVVILFSNFLQLAYPKEPHPIELEIKANRRWVLLDYYDERMSDKTITDVAHLGTRMRCFRNMATDLRAELWILHRVESLYNFGWIHGIPGCVKPGAGSNRGWGLGGLNSIKFQERRARLMAQNQNKANGAEIGANMGPDSWGEYKGRMLKAMSSVESDELPEDDFAKSVRMAVDPTFANKLAAQAKRAVMANIAAQKKFHRSVREDFSGDLSPRDLYDREQRQILEKFIGKGKNQPPPQQQQQQVILGAAKTSSQAQSESSKTTDFKKEEHEEDEETSL